MLSTAISLLAARAALLCSALLSPWAMLVSALPSQPQPRPPPTLSCGPCKEPSGEKWCRKCYTAPIHCTLEFSVPCDSVVDRYCADNVGSCVHPPGSEPPDPLSLILTERA